MALCVARRIYRMDYGVEVGMWCRGSVGSGGCEKEDVLRGLHWDSEL